MPYREEINAERSLVTSPRTCLGALCERLWVVEAQRSVRVKGESSVYMREYTTSVGTDGVSAASDGAFAYMNKGGTAERIGPCEEGLIVPAVLHFYTEKGESSWQRKRS